MIATILGILLFLYLMLSINHANTPPANRERFTSNAENPYLQDVMRRVKENTEKSTEIVSKPPVLPTWEKPIVIKEPDNTEIMPHLKNISTSKTPLNWFEHSEVPPPSPAELIIMKELSKYRLSWFREISFYGLQTTKCATGYPRFDFILHIPSAPMKVILIEYQGEAFHKTPERKASDRLKAKFCKDNNLPLLTYDKKHYYNMEVCIASLMAKYKIYRK